MHGVRAGGYYGPAGARKRSPQYTYLLRIFIIPATGIFIVTTLETSRPSSRKGALYPVIRSTKQAIEVAFPCREYISTWIVYFLLPHLLLFHPFLSDYLTLKFIPRRIKQRKPVPSIWDLATGSIDPQRTTYFARRDDVASSAQRNREQFHRNNELGVTIKITGRGGCAKYCGTAPSPGNISFSSFRQSFTSNVNYLKRSLSCSTNMDVCMRLVYRANVALHTATLA
ncbi:hypothetical protein ALC62_05393 [Cyphomyrmex costatus]|uniref:Uncharacterized protein n=1 Tax=Cyphomyrmex costatus TaxID=456900 RepID=A0A195CT49_9HYME|nr:hypothetical protein ALC62_05393 [Cyphomyrmex costatus]